MHTIKGMNAFSLLRQVYCKVTQIYLLLNETAFYFRIIKIKLKLRMFKPRLCFVNIEYAL